MVRLSNLGIMLGQQLSKQQKDIAFGSWFGWALDGE